MNPTIKSFDVLLIRMSAGTACMARKVPASAAKKNDEYKEEYVKKDLPIRQIAFEALSSFASLLLRRRYGGGSFFSTCQKRY